MDLPLTITDFQKLYQEKTEPEHIIRLFWERLYELGTGPTGDTALIYVPPWDEVSIQLQNLKKIDSSRAPLFGVPFVVKDNIDIKGWPTTAACPSFSYKATSTAYVVDKLRSAGAIVLAKTNLDQFATGLVGTRSPYGVVKNPFDGDYICGGSSSGSASLVARGLVCFSLGTDTAGSGRIPAGFCNLVGTKPTPGLVSTQGVVPACRTIDCVSFFTLCVEDARIVLSVTKTEAQDRDLQPQFSPPPLQHKWTSSIKVNIGIPTNLSPLSQNYRKSFDRSIEYARNQGWNLIPIDMTVLNEVAKELYEGPWITERYSTIEDLIQADPDSIDPNVFLVINKGKTFSALDAFKSLYSLKERTVQANALFKNIDALLVPTAPEHPKVQDIKNDPIGRNALLGTYTNFVNLLGWSALALPAGFTEDDKPFGITLIGQGGYDFSLLELGAAWQKGRQQPLGAHLKPANGSRDTSTTVYPQEDGIRIAVVGAHLEGMPLHWQVKKAGAYLYKRTSTSNYYRLYSLQNSEPPKPGLKRLQNGGDSIEVEVYDFPAASVGEFLSQIPHPLGLGTIELCDGSWVKGFICEPIGLENSEDITKYKGWRAFCSTTQ